MKAIFYLILRIAASIGVAAVFGIGTFMLILAVDIKIDMILNSHTIDSQFGGRFIAESVKIIFPITLAVVAIVTAWRLKNED